uniref:Retrovirus-related Pol polyprotein from transposon TNT 1-94 n=1 Tax=Tanacetum cinerariifolium TaxID=118510 RepID=A0A699GUI7_TANCI|nr:retrovirus-related Pol polyprotein from transposon TNT 1-94 [Tanacetum cinerariifolium]
MQNFEIQFLKEAAKFVRDLQSLVKEADESLSKHKALELEIEHLLRAIVSQDIMSVVQNNYVVDTSNLQTELEQCKYDKIPYDNAYNNMHQKIELLQAQLGDQKGKSKDTPCVSNTLDPLPRKLENENVELEFQLRAQQFDKVSQQKDNTKGTSANTKFANQTNLGNVSLRNHYVVRQPNAFQSKRTKWVLPKVVELNNLSNLVTSNSVPTTKESKVLENDKVITPGMFRINPSKNSREVKSVPNKPVNASVRTKPITDPQPHAITKKVVNSDSHEILCFLRMIGGKLIQLMHTTMVPEQVKTMKIQAGIQVSRPKEFRRQLQLWKRFGRLYLIVFVLVRNIVVFLISKDEAPEEIKTFLKKITILLQAPVIIVRTDNSIKFKNQVLKEYFDSVGITHQVSYVRTPQQNGVVERRNQTLVETARTMLIFSRAPLFLWAEAIATACYTQNCSIIHRRFDKTTYELINDRTPNISFLHVFGALCYPKNDYEDIGKLGAKGDIGFFIGYSANSCTYRVYNRRTKKIMETMNVTFDELSPMDFEQITAPRTAPAAQVRQVLQTPSATTTTADFAPTTTNSSSQATNIPNTSQDVDELKTQQQHAQQHENQAPLQPKTVVDNAQNAMLDENTFVNSFATPSTNVAESSSSQYNGSYQDIFGICCTQIIHCVSNGRENRILAWYAKKDVYVCQPEGFIDVDHPSHVYKLKNALYGLKQAPRAWYDELSKFLLHNHFFKGTIDRTLFIRRFDDDILVVQVYVNDIIFCSTHPRYTQLFFDLMKSRFEMSMIGEMMFFLSLQVNQFPFGIFINQSNYVLEILIKYGVETCVPVRTPMEIKDKLDLDQNGSPVDATKYRSMIGALMYLTSSRPNIVHATCLCARYQAKPTEKHPKGVYRIFRYLWRTVNMGLWYTKDSGFKLTGFLDVDYTGCKDTFKGTSGGAQFLGENLLTDYGFHFNKIPIYCDSKSAIAISCNPVQHSRTKHIAVCYHFIKEHVEKGTIELYFVKTDYQLADLFTKALPVD